MEKEQKEQRRGQYPCPIRTRVSAEHFENLTQDAAIAGMSLCKYVRHRLTGHQIRSRYDAQVLNELRRQGGLLKHLALKGVETGAALEEIIKTMRKLRREQ